ncbi:hypothetical protein MMC25_003529 [Agyrium rufum]|nr:hypothetical protein [Agyrium rufum]
MDLFFRQAAGAVQVPDKGPEMFNTVVAMVAVSTFFVICRLIVRFRTTGTWGTDDVLICGSVLFAVLVTIFDCLAVKHGFGKHGKNLTIDQLHGAFKFFYLAQPPYKAGVCCTKLSILALYHRIFNTGRFPRYNLSLMAFILTYSIAFILVSVFQCIPIQKSWNKALSGYCVNNEGQWYSFAVLNIISDIAIMILPMPVIQKLQLPKGQKIGLSLVFLLGAFVCGTSIYRMIALASGSKSMDPTYGSVEATVWTDIELNTGIICACLPVFKAPVMRLFPRLFPGLISSNRRSNQLGGSDSYGLSGSKGYGISSSGNRRSRAFNSAHHGSVYYSQELTDSPKGLISASVTATNVVIGGGMLVKKTAVETERSLSQERIVSGGVRPAGVDDRSWLDVGGVRNGAVGGIKKTTHIGITYDDGESGHSLGGKSDGEEKELDTRY